MKRKKTTRRHRRATLHIADDQNKSERQILGWGGEACPSNEQQSNWQLTLPKKWEELEDNWKECMYDRIYMLPESLVRCTSKVAWALYFAFWKDIKLLIQLFNGFRVLQVLILFQSLWYVVLQVLCISYFFNILSIRFHSILLCLISGLSRFFLILTPDTVFLCLYSVRWKLSEDNQFY